MAPTDSNGNYSLPDGYLAVTGETILPSQHNPPLQDLATGMTARVMRNGSAPMTGNLPFAGYKITGLGVGTVSGDAVNKGQLDAIAGFWSKLTEAIKTDDYTVLAADAGLELIANKATAIAFALPVVASSTGFLCGVRNIGVGDLTIDPNGAETIEGVASLVLKTGDAAIIWASSTTWRAFLSRRKATQAEAVAGAAVDIFMDPQRTRQAIDGYAVPMIGLPMPKGLVVQVTSDTAVDIDADEVVVSDGTNYKALKNVNLTATLPTDLDTGAEASNTFYKAYVLYNPTTGVTDKRLVAQANTITLPTGFTFSRYVGSVRNNSSSNLYRTIQRGNAAMYVHGTNPSGPLVMATGTNAGSNVSVTGFIPASAYAIYLACQGGTDNNGASTTVAESASQPGFIVTSSTTENGVIGTQMLMFLSGTTFRYASNAAAGSTGEADALGWLDAI